MSGSEKPPELAREFDSRTWNSDRLLGFHLTDCNYLHAVAISQDRFGQTDQLIDAHMQALLELPKPTNSLHSLHSFHDTVESHTRGLSSLGKSGETY